MKKNKNKIAMKVSVSNEAATYLKTVFIVFALFLLAYGFIAIMSKTGVFDKGYVAPELEEAVFSYENILAGTVFNRADKEYYVVFDTFAAKELDVYLKYILESADVELPIYKVDMSLTENLKYKSDTSNTKVQKASDLKINGVTLIKIKNGKNVLYLDDIEKIKSELITE